MRNTAISSSVVQNKLQDFDWQLKLIMSSDKLSGINEPVVSVDFNIQTCDSGVENKTVELSKEELKKLLTSIEAANRVSRTLLLKNL